MNKTQARELLKGDYIPNGKRFVGKISDLEFRHTMEWEVYRCGAQSSYDLQSGPIYCGNLAEYVFEFSPAEGGGILCLCNERHRPLKVKE